MKKILSLALLALVLLTSCASIISCEAPTPSSPPLSYGEEYVYENDSCEATLTFNKDGTGLFTSREKKGEKRETVIDFMWDATSSNDAIYLFEKEVDTEFGESNYAWYSSLTELPLSFSKDVIGWMTSSGGIRRFIRAGSPLEECGSDNG